MEWEMVMQCEWFRPGNNSRYIISFAPPPHLPPTQLWPCFSQVFEPSRTHTLHFFRSTFKAIGGVNPCAGIPPGDPSLCLSLPFPMIPDFQELHPPSTSRGKQKDALNPPWFPSLLSAGFLFKPSQHSQVPRASWAFWIHLPSCFLNWGKEDALPQPPAVWGLRGNPRTPKITYMKDFWNSVLGM